MLRLLFFFIFYTSYSYSQERFTLNGYITDSESGESLIGATVYINQMSSGTITNPYGFYSITLDEGKYDIDFRYIGYQTISREVELFSNLKIDVEKGDPTSWDKFIYERINQKLLFLSSFNL